MWSFLTIIRIKLGTLCSEFLNNISFFKFNVLTKIVFEIIEIKQKKNLLNRLLDYYRYSYIYSL